jgi:alpha-tubulin suppressor-like RCC1 family protein
MTEEEIQTEINSLVVTDTAIDAMVLVAETANITTNRSVAVSDVNSLPDLEMGTIAPGTVFFVESIGVPVVAGIGSWKSIDNRVIRQDTSAATAWAWGTNTTGQLGDSTTLVKSSPVLVVGESTKWCQVSSGQIYSAGITTDGTIWAWGTNSSGQLGNGTTVSQSSPVLVVGEFTDWCQASIGYSHLIAVRIEGTAWAWGTGANGRLGDSTTTNKSSPVSVVGGFTDWSQVSAGRYHSLGLRTNGTAWSWGFNSNGRLGDGTTVDTSSPVSVVGCINWCQVAAGSTHSLALTTTGTAWAWGYNGTGRLGDNSIVEKSSPVLVAGDITNWCQLSAGDAHSLALTTTGAAWAWGLNTCGRLGDGTLVGKSSPVPVVGGFTDWCQLSAGLTHSLAVRQTGTAWAWGQGTNGRLGDNTTINKSSPVPVVGEFADWCQVSAGSTHSLGIRIVD